MLRIIHKVAHGPHTGPESLDSGGPRQADADLDVARRETDLVPPLQHPTDVIQVVSRFAFHGDHELSVLGGDLARVIPFDIVSWPIMQVHGFPVWIVSGVEGSSITFEFITEHDVVRHTIRPDAGLCGSWGGIIDQRWEVGEFVDLAGAVDGAESISVRGVPGNGNDDRVCAEQSQDSERQGEENQNIGPTSTRE